MSEIELNKSISSVLDRFEGKYELIKIDPEFADTIDFCEKYEFPLENSGNTIIVASKKISPVKFCACLVKASTRLDVIGMVKKPLIPEQRSLPQVLEFYGIPRSVG